MEKPSPRSAFSNRNTCGSEAHMASPESGSMERDRSRDMLVVSVTEVVAPLEAREPSDFAFTNRSEGNS